MERQNTVTDLEHVTSSDPWPTDPPNHARLGSKNRLVLLESQEGLQNQDQYRDAPRKYRHEPVGDTVSNS